MNKSQTSHLLEDLIHAAGLKVNMTSDFVLYVKGKEIHMNDFVAKVISDVMMAILSNLRDIDLETITKIEVQ